MKKALAVVLSCLALAAASSQVHAASIVYANQNAPMPVPGTATPVLLNGVGIVPPSQAPIVTPAYSVTFTGVNANQGVVQGTNASFHAVPVAGMSAGLPTYLTGDFGSLTTTNIANSGNYLSTGNGTSTITITFTTPQNELALLWGSIDSSNSLTFGASDTVTGAQAAAAAGVNIPGFQGFGGSAWFVFAPAAGTFTSVTLTSGIVSFESVAEDAGRFVIPEPASVALAGTGLGFVGLVGFVRARRGRRLLRSR
jgi:hypothetical protein